MVKNLGATGAWGAVGALVLIGAACDLPSNREREFVGTQIRKVAGVQSSRVEPGDGFRLLASDTLTTAVEFPDGKSIHFARVGYNAFGPNAVNVVVSEADGLVPRIASCNGVAFPNFHREAALGHHFQPTLIDIKDALERANDVLEEVQFWPQCPQSWEVQDKFGVNYRYCAHRRDAPADPPRPAGCP